MQQPLSNSDYKELFHRSPFALLLCSTAVMTVDEGGTKRFSGGELIEFNQAFADIIGYTIKETRETTFLKLTPEKYKDAEAEQLESLVRTGKYGPYEKEYIHKSGQLVPIRLSGQIVKIGDREYIWSIIQVISTEELEVFNKAPSRHLALSRQRRAGYCGKSCLCGKAGLHRARGSAAEDDTDYSTSELARGSPASTKAREGKQRSATSKAIYLQGRI